MLNFKKWAVIGDVLNEEKYAYKIVARLERNGYQVYKVNPRSGSEKVYKSLREIKDKVDVIDLVIHPKVGLKMIEEAKEVGIDKVLIQPGASSDEILKFCEESKIQVHEGCVLVELAKKGLP